MKQGTYITPDGVEIYYKDWGTGPVVTFSHGWPLSADAWDAQMLFLGQKGYRVIAHDRRGHGRSEQSWQGNNMDQYLRLILSFIGITDVQTVRAQGMNIPALSGQAIPDGEKSIESLAI
jgi:non-heme chloroperoxidase